MGEQEEQAEKKSFRAPPAILQKVLGFKALKHKEGGFSLWDVPSLIFPIESIIVLTRILEKAFGETTAADIMFSAGKFQGENAFDLITKRFGYGKTIPDKVNLLKFNTGQSEVIGLGSIEWVRIDYNSKHFIARGDLSYPKIYRSKFGMQKIPIDHFFRGLAYAYISKTVEEEMLVVETNCIAKGNPKCQFVAKPKKNWKNSEIPPFQIPKKIYTMEELETMGKMGFAHVKKII